MGRITPTLPPPGGIVRRPPTLPLPGTPVQPAFGDLLGSLLEAMRPLSDSALRAPRPDPVAGRASSFVNPGAPPPDRRPPPDRAENDSRARQPDEESTADDPSRQAEAAPVAVAAPAGARSPADVKEKESSTAAVPTAPDATASALDPTAPPEHDAAAAPVPATGDDPTPATGQLPAALAAAAESPPPPELPTQPALGDAVVEAVPGAPDAEAAPAPPAASAEAAALAAPTPAPDGSALGNAPQDGGRQTGSDAPGREPAPAVIDRAARPAAAARITRTDRPDPSAMVDRILRAAQLSRGSGPTRIRLLLQPPELGTLRLTLSVKDNAVSASVLAETAGARALLAGNLVSLREALEQQGLQLGSFQVSVSQQGNDAPSFDAPSRGPALASADAGRPAVEASAPAPLRLRSVGRTRIDLVA